MEKKNIRIAAYLRVSTDEQAKEGYGIDTQIRHIKNLVDANSANGWTLDDKNIYKDEGYSGTLKERPALNRMLDNAKAKQFDVLVVWKIDRLFRNMRMLLETIDKLGEYDVGFKSVTEPFDTTAVGKFIFQIFGALAEFERNLIITRTSEGKISSAKDGNFVGGNIPYGYRVIKQKPVVIEEEAEWVRKIFVWFVDYELSIDAIAKKLEKLKVPSKGSVRQVKDGKKGKIRKKKNYAYFWHSSAVREILEREHYIGKYYYNRRGKGKDGKEYLKPRNQWIEFDCPAIVSQEIFRKAQARFEKLKHLSNNAQRPYLFSTKIECGECKSMFTGYTSAKNTKNYRCGKNNKAKTSKQCKARQISEKLLEEVIWNQVKVFLQNPEAVLSKIEEDLKKGQYFQRLLDEKKLLEKRRTQMKDSRLRVKEAFRRGTYTQQELEEEISIINKEQYEIEEELEAVNAQLTTEESKYEKIASVQEMVKKYRKNLQRLDYDDKYVILQSLVKKIILKGDKIKLELRIPKRIQDELNKSYGLYGGTDGTRTRDLHSDSVAF